MQSEELYQHDEDTETSFDGLYSEPVNLAAGGSVSAKAKSAIAKLQRVLRAHFDMD